MTAGWTVTPLGRAEVAKAALAARYRDQALRLLEAAETLEGADPRDLADAGRPVPYLHPSCRAEVDALDAALVAL